MLTRMLPWIRSQFSCNSTDTPQVNNFTSVCPVRWKHVSNVAGTQMLYRENLAKFERLFAKANVP